MPLYRVAETRVSFIVYIYIYKRERERERERARDTSYYWSLYSTH